MARLIVNADDLGLTRGVNRAIIRAHQEGVVTSATLMANASAFADAVDLLRSVAPRALSIGCHLVFIDGTPLSPPESIPSLLDPEVRAPRFHRNLWKFALAAVRGKIAAREVAIEATAQIRKVQAAGIEISHVDCHKHTHMFPAVLEGVLQAASAEGIRALRNPFEPGFARPMSISLSRKNSLRSAETALLQHRYSRFFLDRVRESGLITTDGSIGVTVTGALDQPWFAQTIQSLPTVGTYEFVCHPGYNDADLASAGTRLLQSRETELNVLCSPESRLQLESAHAELINFWDLLTVPESIRSATHPTQRDL